MKSLPLILASVSASVCMAAPALIGGQADAALTCVSVDDSMGVGFSLEVARQALAPQYSVRGITVVSQVIGPKYQPVKTELEQISQTATKAVFSSETFKVVLNKSKMKAKLYIDDQLAFWCEESPE